MEQSKGRGERVKNTGEEAVSWRPLWPIRQTWSSLREIIGRWKVSSREGWHDLILECGVGDRLVVWEASVEASVLMPALVALAETRGAAREMVRVIRSWECSEGSVWVCWQMAFVHEQWRGWGWLQGFCLGVRFRRTGLPWTKTGTRWKSGCWGEDHGFAFEDIKLKTPIRRLRTDVEGMIGTGVWVQESGLDWRHLTWCSPACIP